MKKEDDWKIGLRCNATGCMDAATTDDGFCLLHGAQTAGTSAQQPTERSTATHGNAGDVGERGCPIKERPIIFSAPMVRAIIDGRKTQTRRVVSNANCNCTLDFYKRLVWNDDDVPESRRPAVVPDGSWYGAGNGYAKVMARPHPDDPQDDPEFWTRYRMLSVWVPGDRLWVRETWQHHTDDTGHACIAFRSDGASRQALYDEGGEGDFSRIGGICKATMPVASWRSPIYMPRTASRLTLEVVAVRVERLNGISVGDCHAEGIPPTWDGQPSEIESYERLWDSINGHRHPWSSNPWVWVIEFKKLDARRDIELEPNP